MKSKAFTFISFLLFFTVSSQIKKSVSSEKKTVKINSYEEYKEKELNPLIKVSSGDTPDVLKLYGYHKNDTLLSHASVRLERYKSLAVDESKWIGRSGYWQFAPISITSIPFKIRPKQVTLDAKAISGLNNLGLNLSIWGWKLDRYFLNGKKSTHKISVGGWIAPSVEELDSLQTRGVLALDETRQQLFVSAGFTINYTYNNLTFSVVPMGYDFGTSTLGKEWIYNKKRWWGFGIGLQPKFFDTIVNK